MAATPDPTPTEQTLVTLFSARMQDMQELVNERMQRLTDQLQHDRTIQAREHKQLHAAVRDLHQGVGELRARFDDRVDGIDERVDDLESDRDVAIGGRRSIRDLIATTAAAVAVVAGLNGLHIL